MTDLASIRTKVRRLTGRPSSQQITDTQIDDYVNTFYQYDLPEHLRLFSLRTTFEFMTIANVDTYDLRTMNITIGGVSDTAANVYYNLSPPAYVAGYQSFHSQNREEFFRIYPPLASFITTVSGDGTPGPYTFTFPNTPFLQNSVSVGAIDDTGATVQLVDDPQDRTTGNWKIINTETAGVGSINYITGAGTVTFTNNIPSGNSISLASTPYTPSRPQGIMFYDNVLTLRPVPDQPYKVNLEAYITPTALLSSGANPELKQWWQYLAYGAAKKIFEDTQDPESLNVLMPGFKEQEQLVLRRTIVQQTNERTATIYTEQSQFPYNNLNFRF
jgi:hypothetical protein